MRKYTLSFFTLLFIITLHLTSCSTDEKFSNEAVNETIYVQEINISNNGIALFDSVFPIELNESNFDFTRSCDNGSGIRFFGLSDKGEFTQELDYWIEEYSAEKKSAKIWIQAKYLEPGNDELQIQYSPAWCSETKGNGYRVFETFVDKQDDMLNWSFSDSTLVSESLNKEATVISRKMIVDDQNYNFVPDLLVLDQGDVVNGESLRKYILTWTKKRYHVDQYYDIMVMIGYQTGSQDINWSDPKSIYSGSPDKDPVLLRTSDDVLHNCYVKRINAGEVEMGLACSRSYDYGETWDTPVFLAKQPSDIYVIDQFVEVDGELYIVAQGKNFTNNMMNTAFWHSIDNGLTWKKISEIAPYGSSYMESAMAYLGDGKFIVITRSTTEWGDGTYKFISNDFGKTWSEAVNILDQVGTLHYPTLNWMGDHLVLLGREAITDTIGSSNRTGLKQFGLFISHDNGMSFQDSLLIDDYRLGRQHDGGYGHLFPLSSEKALVPYCADKSGDYMPSILIAEIDFKSEIDNSGLYFQEAFVDSPIKREFRFLSENSELVFHFKLLPTLGGNNLHVSFQDTQDNDIIAFFISSASGEGKPLIVKVGNQVYETNHVLDEDKFYKFFLRTDIEKEKLNLQVIDSDEQKVVMVKDLNLTASSISAISSLNIGSMHYRRAMKMELSYLYQVSTMYDSLAININSDK